MIYAVSLGAQKELIEKYCFDLCKKICIGGIIIEGGDFLPCREKICRYSEKEMILEGKIDGEGVTVRKLRNEGR